INPILKLLGSFLQCSRLWVRDLKLKRKMPVASNAFQLGQMPLISFPKLAKKYGDVYQIYWGCIDVVVLNRAQLIREALFQHSREFARKPHFMSFQSVSGDKKSWTFSNHSNSHIKKSFEHQFASESKELVENLLKLCTQTQHFNLKHQLTVGLANAISALCFGKCYCDDDLEFRALLDNIDQFGQTVMVIRVMIDAIIKVLAESEDDPETTMAGLIGVGKDTLSTTIYWIVLLLAKHPDIQTNSMSSVTRWKDGTGCFQEYIYTQPMCFTSFVLNTIPHPTTSDVTLGISWSVNHDLLIWKNHEIFDPSRLLDEKGSLDKDFFESPLYFSIGSKSCKQ
uniref:Cytochrome P450, family 1, subfamily C, polypeptide 2 n=1 Tax=Cyprinodon variegatus TaxID=28743 RepID=A0A3Q2CXK1_CYPVA